MPIPTPVPPPTAGECQATIRTALQRFGSYAYYDKGAHEVIDLDPLVARFRAAGGAVTGLVLTELLRLEPKAGSAFASAVISSLDDMPEAEFLALLDTDPALADLY